MIYFFYYLLFVSSAMMSVLKAEAFALFVKITQYFDVLGSVQALSTYLWGEWISKWMNKWVRPAVSVGAPHPGSFRCRPNTGWAKQTLHTGRSCRHSGPMPGLVLCCHHLEIITEFLTRGPTFHFVVGLQTMWLDLSGRGHLMFLYWARFLWLEQKQISQTF